MILEHYDYIIVGCGLYGVTCARQLTNKGYSCLVIDKNNYLGGMCHTYKYNNIDIHENGIHIFHTSDEDVWKFVTKYSHFKYIELKVCTTDGENVYSLPFNMYTFSKFLGLNTPEEVHEYLSQDKIDNPQNLEEQAINTVGEKMYNKFIKPYTEKQWGVKCTELPKSIIERLPIRYSYDNNYFKDKYQGIPENGYTELVEHIINGINADGKPFEGNIDYILNIDFLEDKEKWINMADNIIYCGAVDELLDYELGELPWRSLKFEHTIYNYNGHNGQGCPLLNNINPNTSYTRSIDHVQINPDTARDHRGDTILTYEYPQKWDRTKERYYPMQNEELCSKYINLLQQKYPSITLGGRIGLYKYMDMDDTIKQAIEYCCTKNKELTEAEQKFKPGKVANIWCISTNNECVWLSPNYFGNKFVTNYTPSKHNINKLNRFLCEFVGMYYVYKNNVYSPYVGFCHYRRLAFIQNCSFNDLTNDNIQCFSKFEVYNSAILPFIEDTFEYPFLERKRKEMYVPKKIMDDAVEYLHKQTVIPQDKLKQYTTIKKGEVFYFYPREMYFCKWEVFCELMQFICGYIDFVSSKYNLITFDDWKSHVRDEVISYHKKLGREYVDSHNERECFCIFQSKEKFMSIFNEEEGFSTANNWRVYAYIIEDLISIFIGTHNPVDNNLIEHKRQFIPGK